MHTQSTDPITNVDTFAIWTIEQDIPLSKLEVNPDYQRPIRQPWVRQIVRTFDPALCDKLRVAERDGHYYVVNGQHRLAALRILAAGVDRAVRCDVQILDTPEEEARLFYLLNRSVAPLHASEVMRARIAAGDPYALGIRDTLERFGYRLSWRLGGRPQSGTCASYALLDVIYGTPKVGGAATPNTVGSPEVLADVLGIFRSAYGDSKHLGSSTLGTIYRLLRRYDGRPVDRVRLAVVLNGLDLDDGPEVPAMQQALGIQSRDYAGVAAVVRRYNVRLSEPKRLPLDMAA